MEFNSYQRETDKTAHYPFLEGNEGQFYGFLYPALGLAGETGEVLEIIKKIVRDRRDVSSVELDKIELELGDVLWYLAQLASRFGLSLNGVAMANLEKLEERYKDRGGCG